MTLFDRALGAGTTGGLSDCGLFGSTDFFGGKDTPDGKLAPKLDDAELVELITAGLVELITAELDELITAELDELITAELDDATEGTIRSPKFLFGLSFTIPFQEPLFLFLRSNCTN